MCICDACVRVRVKRAGEDGGLEEGKAVGVWLVTVSVAGFFSSSASSSTFRGGEKQGSEREGRMSEGSVKSNRRASKIASKREGERERKEEKEE